MNATSVWVWALVGWVPWAIWAYLVTHPTTLVNILKAYTSSQAIIDSILNKIKNGIKLSASEAKLVWQAIQDQAKATNVWVMDILNQ